MTLCVCVCLYVFRWARCGAQYGIRIWVLHNILKAVASSTCCVCKKRFQRSQMKQLGNYDQSLL